MVLSSERLCNRGFFMKVFVAGVGFRFLLSDLSLFLGQ